MRMLYWMSGHIRQDRITKERNKEKVGVALIVEKMVDSRLRWFGHVWRRFVEASVMRVDQMEGTISETISESDKNYKRNH